MNYLIINYKNFDSEKVDFAHQLKDYNNYQINSIIPIENSDLSTIELAGVVGAFTCPNNWIIEVNESIDELFREFISFTAIAKNQEMQGLILKIKILLGDFYEE